MKSLWEDESEQRKEWDAKEKSNQKKCSKKSEDEPKERNAIKERWLLMMAGRTEMSGLLSSGLSLNSGNRLDQREFEATQREAKKETNNRLNEKMKWTEKRNELWKKVLEIVEHAKKNETQRRICGLLFASQKIEVCTKKKKRFICYLMKKNGQKTCSLWGGGELIA